jgi:Trp operon repressor
MTKEQYAQLMKTVEEAEGIVKRIDILEHYILKENIQENRIVSTLINFLVAKRG